METDAATVGLTAMVMRFEVAGLPDGQEIFDVRIQVTVFPSDGMNE